MNEKEYVLRVESKKEGMHFDLGIISCSEYPRVGDVILYGKTVTRCGNEKSLSEEDRSYIVTSICRRIPIVDPKTRKSVEDTISVVVDFLE